MDSHVGDLRRGERARGEYMGFVSTRVPGQGVTQRMTWYDAVSEYTPKEAVLFRLNKHVC
jgi:hypothetical protein